MSLARGGTGAAPVGAGEVAIAPMRREDLDEMMEIERASYPAPWGREVFLDELHRAFAHVEVLRVGGALRGYVNYWEVSDEVHVLNLSVHPEHRRAGLGRRLVERVFEFGRRRAARFVTLEVRRSNRAALALYRRQGFRPVGVRPRYYEDREDAIVMVRDL